MTYKFDNGGSPFLDQFILKMMRDVLADHAVQPKHDYGFCCQVNADYSVLVAKHDEAVAKRKAAEKTEGTVFKPSTPGQAKYLRDLARRVPPHLLAPASRLLVERVQAQHEVEYAEASRVIEELKSLAYGPEDLAERNRTSETRRITPAQLGFLKVLLAERVHSYELDLTALADIPFSEASDMITKLKKAERKPKESAKAKAAEGETKTEKPKNGKRKLPDEGVYLYDGVYFKVIISENTGNTTARRWDHDGECWVYVGQQPFRYINDTHKLTAEQAAAFGELYHRCVFCTRQLTRKESEDAGYGPDCAARYNLPWG